MIDTKHQKEVWVYRSVLGRVVCEFLTIQECGRYEAWADVRTFTRSRELRPLDHVCIPDREYDRHTIAWTREPEWHEPLPPIKGPTSMDETKGVFLNGTFIQRALVAVDTLKEVIDRPTPNTQMAGWKATEKANTDDMVKGAMALAQCFLVAIDGMGKALERSAEADERLASYAAIDINATVEQAVADRIDAEKEKALDAWKSDATKRNFIGKPT